MYEIQLLLYFCGICSSHLFRQTKHVERVGGVAFFIRHLGIILKY